jgi:hypothetical protein
MRYTSFVLAALVATALPSLASAQRVSADIRIGSGPIDGRIVVGEPVGAYHRRIVEVDGRDDRRSAYGEVVVVRVHRGQGWWRNRGYRAVTVWYDADRDRYYDLRDRFDDRDGMRQVVIYQRDGRYYGDQDERRDDRGYESRSRDRDGGDRHHGRADNRDNRGRD